MSREFFPPRPDSRPPTRRDFRQFLPDLLPYIPAALSTQLAAERIRVSLILWRIRSVDEDTVGLARDVRSYGARYNHESSGAGLNPCPLGSHLCSLTQKGMHGTCSYCAGGQSQKFLT
jgi:hypothetical protein